MKEGATLVMVILMAYPVLLTCMIAFNFILLLIALFTGFGWWLLVMGAIATTGFIAWRWWFMSRLEHRDEL